jgi:hypothetical protein
MLETNIDRWKAQALAEGMQQGMLQGVLQGVLQGEGAMLMRLLTRRFGVLPEWVKPRLDQASTALLEAWGDRVLDAKSLDEVFVEVIH